MPCRFLKLARTLYPFSKYYKLLLSFVLLNSSNLSLYFLLNKSEGILLFALFDRFSFSHDQMSYFVCVM